MTTVVLTALKLYCRKRQTTQLQQALMGIAPGQTCLQTLFNEAMTASVAKAPQSTAECLHGCSRRMQCKIVESQLASGLPVLRNYA